MCELVNKSIDSVFPSSALEEEGSMVVGKCEAVKLGARARLVLGVPIDPGVVSDLVIEEPRGFG